MQGVGVRREAALRFLTWIMVQNGLVVFFFFFLVVLGIELRASCSIIGATPSVLL
jgi:hypothetical protein